MTGSMKYEDLKNSLTKAAAVIRKISCPSTACCTLPMYIGFMLSESKQSSCCRLGEVMSISHNSVNRFFAPGSLNPYPKVAWGQARSFTNDAVRPIADRCVAVMSDGT